MDNTLTLESQAERLQQGIETAFGVRGSSLAVAFNRTGRRLPRKLRTDAACIVTAQNAIGHPKLMRQLDYKALTAAEARILNYLSGIDRKDRRKGLWLGIWGSVVFNLIAVALLFIVWLVWSGTL